MFYNNDTRHIDFNYIKYIHRDTKELLSIFDKYNSKYRIYFDYKQKLVPRSLYKYYKPKSCNFDAVMNDYIWISNPKDFNDPFEEFVYYDQDGYLRTLLADYIKREKLIKNDSIFHFSEKEYNYIRWGLKYNSYRKTDLYYIENTILVSKSEEFRTKIVKFINTIVSRYYKVIKEIYQKKLYVFSFSEEFENLPMWAHYTDNYKGFCIEYDLSKIKQNLDDNSVYILNRLYPVKYTSRKQEISKTSLMTKNSHISKINIEDKRIKSLTSKDRSWAYEHEWRLLFDGHNKHGYKFKFPYAKKIICGYNMKKMDIEKLHNICQEKNIDLVIKYKSTSLNISGSFDYTYDQYIKELEFEKEILKYKKLISKKKKSIWLIELHFS